jgi:16S rRNA processing protein RimM
MLEVGRIGKAHGLRGEVVVSLITDRLERLAPGATLIAGERELEVVTSRPHQRKYIVAFAGVESREDADQLNGLTLSAEPLDDSDELWVHELIGLPVVADDGTAVGVVESVQANPASDLLVLDTGTLIPAVFVVEQRDGTVVVDLPDGLLDL